MRDGPADPLPQTGQSGRQDGVLAAELIVLRLRACISCCWARISVLTLAGVACQTFLESRPELCWSLAVSIWDASGN